jgi:hypothetical protein
VAAFVVVFVRTWHQASQHEGSVASFPALLGMVSLVFVVGDADLPSGTSFMVYFLAIFGISFFGSAKDQWLRYLGWI